MTPEVTDLSTRGITTFEIKRLSSPPPTISYTFYKPPKPPEPIDTKKLKKMFVVGMMVGKNQ